MFEGCDLYLDDISSFMVKPTDEDVIFLSETNWGNASMGAPYVYFIPDSVKNISLSINDPNNDSNVDDFKLEWDNGDYFPVPVNDINKMKYKVLIKKYSSDGSVEETQNLNETEDAYVTFNLVPGEHQYELIVKAKKFSNI